MTHSLTTHQGPNSPDATTDSLPSGVGATPELDACDWCNRPTSVQHLTPVRDEGLLCPGCFDVLRLEELAS